MKINFYLFKWHIQLIKIRHIQKNAKKNPHKCGFYITKMKNKYYLFENWYLFLAPERPGFFLSTSLGSLVKKPAALSSGRSAG